MIVYPEVIDFLSVLQGLRPAKPYESRVCNCFVFSTGTRLSALPTTREESQSRPWFADRGGEV